MRNTSTIINFIRPTINNPGYNSFTLEPEIRLESYIKAIIFYIVFSDFDKIIFCENSNYNLGKRSKELHKLSESLNKEIEIIQFQGKRKKYKNPLDSGILRDYFSLYFLK